MSRIITEMEMRGLWRELDIFDKELSTESDKLQDLWRSIYEVKGTLENELRILKEKAEFDFLPKEDTIRFNIGGQYFDAAVGILIKDPSSTLAVCCRKQCPFKLDAEGCFYFDRDWWLFRLILSFLRSNVLPSDIETLKELYKEAAFYRLESLKDAIEQVPVNQVNQTFGKTRHNL